MPNLKSLAISAVVALVVVVAYEQVKMRTGKA
jgi:hypothetical protein